MNASGQPATGTPILHLLFLFIASLDCVLVKRKWEVDLSLRIPQVVCGALTLPPIQMPPKYVLMPPLLSASWVFLGSESGPFLSYNLEMREFRGVGMVHQFCCWHRFKVVPLETNLLLNLSLGCTPSVRVFEEVLLEYIGASSTTIQKAPLLTQQFYLWALLVLKAQG